jgi:putative ABC transport system substrate-binding protein
MGAIGRRRFLIAAGGLLVGAVAQAQRAEKLVRVASLSLFSPDLDAHLAAVMTERLAALGWVEGQTVEYEAHYANNQPDRLPALASELLAAHASVIFAGGDLPTLALKKAGGRTPIVFAAVTDPVALGVVQSLARPGGNITGVSYIGSVEIQGKRLELLKEALPEARRVAILATNHRMLDVLVASQKAAADRLGIETTVHKVTTAGELQSAFAAMDTERIQAALVFPGQLLWKERALIGQLSLQHGIPCVAGVSEYADAGCLIAYAPDVAGQVARAAELMDKILRGASPAEIPVERPNLVTLVVSMKTAGALGLTLPSSILLRADRVIE